MSAGSAKRVIIPGNSKRRLTDDAVLGGFPADTAHVKLCYPSCVARNASALFYYTHTEAGSVKNKKKSMKPIAEMVRIWYTWLGVMSMKKEMTIYDIAQEAGVSSATVSRILSNSVGVKQEKRERVQRVIEKYNFRPSALARALSETHSKVIGMMCPDVRNAYYANLFIACEQAAYESGYTLVLNNTSTVETHEIDCMGKFDEQRAEGMIICGGVIDWRPLPEGYREALTHFAGRMPVVVAGETDVANCCQVYIDHAKAMRLALLHLATLGHKRIAFLHGHAHIYQTQTKLRAYKELMEELNLPVRDEYIVDAGNFNAQCGLKGMNRLLSLPEPPTAVIAINDLMAAGALQAILRLGYAVPGDFSIVGFDDSIITDFTEPHISSVHYDYDAYGSALIKTMLARICGGDCPAPAEIPSTLTVKDSCSRIR